MIEIFKGKFSQSGVAYQSLWVVSVRPARLQPFFARSVLPVREHRKMATCLREAATAKAGNAAGGFFEQTPNGYSFSGSFWKSDAWHPTFWTNARTNRRALFVPFDKTQDRLRELGRPPTHSIGKARTFSMNHGVHRSH